MVTFPYEQNILVRGIKQQTGKKQKKRGGGLTLIQCVLKSCPDTERTIQIWSFPHVWFQVQDRFSSHVGQTMPEADPTKSQCLQVLHLSVLLFHNIHIDNLNDTTNVHLYKRSDSIDNTTILWVAQLCCSKSVCNQFSVRLSSILL